MLARAEQVRAAQQLTGEQLEQLVRHTRSCTKAARTQTAPSARASTSKVSSSSSSSDSGGLFLLNCMGSLLVLNRAEGLWG